MEKLQFTLVDDDELIGVSLTHGDAQVIVASSVENVLDFLKKMLDLQVELLQGGQE